MLLSSLLPLYEANFDFGALDTRQGLITAGATCAELGLKPSTRRLALAG